VAGRKKQESKIAQKMGRQGYQNEIDCALKVPSQLVSKKMKEKKI